jgi:hypothetical protein
MTRRFEARTRISLKVLLGRKKQLDRSRPFLECLEGAAGPKDIARGTEVLPRMSRRRCWPERDNSRDRSPASNVLKALLARKRYLEGPKSCLECLEGAAGPKEITRGTEVLPRMSRRRCWPERDNSRSKRQSRRKNSVQIRMTQKRGTQGTSKENPVEMLFKYKRHIPLKLERTFASLCPLSRKENNLHKETRHR